jgi:hypothetical protein
MRINHLALTLLFTGLGLSSPAVAAIAYSAPQQISGDTNVSTTGTLDRAYTFGGTATTVNGVAFSVFPNSSADTATFASHPGNPYGGGASNPYGSLSSSYQTLLSGGYYTDGTANATTASITLNNLISSRNYQIELFVDDSRGGASAARTESIDGQTVAYDVGDTAGGLGQYLVGTFAASGTSQTINFADLGAADVQINALELRAAPEPASLAFFAAGALGLLACRRTNRRNS